MGRKDLFQEPEKKAATPSLPRGSGSGASTAPMSILKKELSNTVRRIQPDLIDGSQWFDRIPGADPDFDNLVESLKAHGQLVPALVRPSATDPSRFEIIYGRRRLAAARELGLPLQAVVAKLDDQAALIAQGTENNQRLDPSFIEKAIFASRLTASGAWTADVVCETLAVHRSLLSRMEKVVREVGEDLLLRIGPCHGVGRRQLEELAEQVNALRHRGVEVSALDPTGDSDAERLENLRAQVISLIGDGSLAQEGAGSGSAQQQEAAPGIRPKTSSSRKLPFGPKQKIAVSLERSRRAISLRFNRTKDTEGFDEWLNENVDDVLATIQDLWLQDHEKPEQ